MPNLEEIRAEKIQVRLEKVALDAQISKALQASEALANQLRELQKEQTAAAQRSASSRSMDAYLGVRHSDDDERPVVRRRHQRSATEAIARWLSGRG